MSFLRKFKKSPYYHYCWYENGKLKSESTKTSVFAIAKEVKRQRDNNFVLTKSGAKKQDIFFKDACEIYLNWAKANKDSYTILQEKLYIKVLLDKVKINMLSDFTNMVLEDFKRIRKEEGIKATSINRCLTTYKSMASFFFREEYWDKKMKSVAFLPEEDPDERYFSLEEIALIKKGNPCYEQDALNIGIYTGFRPGEISHLNFNTNIDFDKRIVSLTMKPGWHTKSRKVRYIKMTDKFYSFLVGLKNRSKSDWLIHSDMTCKRSGEDEPVNEKVLSQMVKRYLRKLGIKKASLKTARHTFCSHLVMSGVDIFTLARLLGHSTVKYTQRYAHLHPDFLKDSVNKLPY